MTELPDFDKQMMQTLWEEAVILADDMIPLMLQAAKKRGFETPSPLNDPAKMVIRRTLAVFLVGCFMNKPILDNTNLDEALMACKHVAKDLLKPRSPIIQ